MRSIYDLTFCYESVIGCHVMYDLWCSNCHESSFYPSSSVSPSDLRFTNYCIFIKQLMVCHSNNSSSLLMLLPQHVSVIRPSLSGIQ
jgi:hypothetical protein